MTVETTTHDVEFGPEGERIRGILHVPSNTGPHAGVILGHGWAMCQDGDLQAYAARIAERGIVALTFDYRRLGRSEGKPRQELNPYDQIEDFRNAISWLLTQANLTGKIGIWGSSYAGGHVLAVAATDSRVTSVVSQVPTISGYWAALRKTHPNKVGALLNRFHTDRTNRALGHAPAMIQTITNGEEAVAYPGSDSYTYMWGQGQEVPTWRNETTLRSLEMARFYEPGHWIDRIGPKPLCMIIADADDTTPTDLQLAAYKNAHEPKELHILPGGHYSVYQEHFDQTSIIAADWFEKTLRS